MKKPFRKVVRTAIATLAIAAGSPLAGAATITVTNLDDAGAGSLRDAIGQANAAAGADTIRFQAGLSGVIPLASEIALTSGGAADLASENRQFQDEVGKFKAIPQATLGIGYRF